MRAIEIVQGVLGLLLVLLLGALCSVALAPAQRPFAAPQPASGGAASSAEHETADASASVAADCGWSRTLRAWVDADGNGRWDRDEPPLPGVTFLIRDTVAQYTTRSFPSDATGSRVVFLLLGGCPAVDFEVSAEAPDRYTLVTPAPLHSDLENDDEALWFGFRELP